MGSTDTAVVLFTSVTDASGAFTHTSAAATGSVFTCRRPGVYRIDFFAALAGAGNMDIGLSLNAVGAGALTGSPLDFAAVDGGAGSEGIIGCQGEVSNGAGDGPVLCHVGRTIRLVQGDVLRFMATAGVTLDTDNLRFFMERLSP